MKDVHWGPLDYLVVDAPPGTSDEHISIAQFLRAGAPAAADGDAAAPAPAPGGAAGGVARNVGGGFDTAVIVTTPQEVSIIDVRKEVSFCRKVGLAVLGVVENMAGLRLPAASPGLRFVLPGGAAAAGGGAGEDGEEDVTARVLAALAAALPSGAAERLEVRAEVFTPSGGGAAAMCRTLGLDLLGRVPLDPGLGRAAEEGRSVFEAAKQQQGGGEEAAQTLPSVAALQSIVRRILAATDEAAGGGGGGGGGTAAQTAVAAMDTAA